MTGSRYAWMDGALCAQTDPDLFTDFGGNGQTPKRICARCPVRTQCAAHASDLHAFEGLAMNGVWGGLSRKQREDQRRMTEAA